MEAIVGRLLSNYLGDYVKDFKSEKFVDWSLNDLGVICAHVLDALFCK